MLSVYACMYFVCHCVQFTIYNEENSNEQKMNRKVFKIGELKRISFLLCA